MFSSNWTNVSYTGNIVRQLCVSKLWQLCTHRSTVEDRLIDIEIETFRLIDIEIETFPHESRKLILKIIVTSKLGEAYQCIASFWI